MMKDYSFIGITFLPRALPPALPHWPALPALELGGLCRNAAHEGTPPTHGHGRRWWVFPPVVGLGQAAYTGPCAVTRPAFPP